MPPPNLPLEGEEKNSVRINGEKFGARELGQLYDTPSNSPFKEGERSSVGGEIMVTLEPQRGATSITRGNAPGIR